jgi:hypothetical protein
MGLTSNSAVQCDLSNDDGTDTVTLDGVFTEKRRESPSSSYVAIAYRKRGADVESRCFQQDRQRAVRGGYGPGEGRRAWRVRSVVRS